MKTRHGFVSNSSSSSFVVAMDAKPNTVLEMQRLLFDDNQTHYCNPYDHNAYGAALVAEVVLQQISEEDPLTQVEAIECVCDGYIGSIDKVLEKEFPYRYDPDSSFKKRMAEEEKRDARHRELAYEYVTDWMLKNDVRGKKLFRFEFGDSDGAFFCALEHGSLFDRLPHIRVSNH